MKKLNLSPFDTCFVQREYLPNLISNKLCVGENTLFRCDKKKKNKK